jgi:uncharacterized RDD family membrane protein YckC
MKKNNMKKDILVPIVVIVSAVAFLDPFMYLMPGMMVSVVLGILMVSSLGYALIVFKEGARDEREVSLRAFADRIACLVGTFGLVGMIVYQVVVIHHVDAFIVVILLAMIVTKYLAHLYAERKL